MPEGYKRSQTTAGGSWQEGTSECAASVCPGAGANPLSHPLSPTLPLLTAEEAVLHVGCGGPGVCGLRPGGQEDPGASARDQTFGHS